MTRNDPAFRSRLQSFQPLSTLKPCWVITVILNQLSCPWISGDSLTAPTILEEPHHATDYWSVLLVVWGRKSHVLDNMAVITDKEESSAVQKIELHADQALEISVKIENGKRGTLRTVCMSREVMERDSLTEVHCSFVESFPIQRELEHIST